MKYARIKTYICLYIFIIFNPLGFLSISGNLHAFHRRIYESSAYFFRRGSQEGLLGLPAPSCACRWASLSLRGHAWHTWWSGAQAPTWERSGGVFCEECILSSHCLPKHGKLDAKTNEGEDVFQKLLLCSPLRSGRTDSPLQSFSPVFSPQLPRRT